MKRPRSKARAPDAAASPHPSAADQVPDDDPSSTQDDPDSPPDDPSTPAYRHHDQSYKGVFEHRVTSSDLVCGGLAPDWHQVFDLANVDYTFTETIAPGPRARRSDFAMEVPFKHGRGSVVFNVEFKSSPNHPETAAVTCGYAHGMFAALLAKRVPGKPIPIILSCVLYTGPGRWTAETSLAALGGAPEPPPEAAQAIAEMGIAHSYRVVDLQWASERNLLPKDSVLEWLGALEREPWKNFPRVHAAMAKKWAKHSAARRSFAEWVDERMRKAEVPEEARRSIREQIIQPTETAQMGMTYTEWAEGHERKGERRGERRGERTGQRKGQEAMVLRLASRKFGAETAERLEGLVGTMGPEQLVGVFDAAMDCETGDDLLAEAANGASIAT